jgi:TonB family protein
VQGSYGRGSRTAQSAFLGKWWPRALILTALIAVHAAILAGALLLRYRDMASGVEAITVATAHFVADNEARYQVPAPELTLKTVSLASTSLEEINFADSVQEELAEVTGPFSVPHLARVQSVEPETFARRARLPPGSTLTTLLRIEVTDDGSVSSADIVGTSGNAAADAAAIAYALELRWVPGTSNQIPKTMRVNFSVTLSSPEST